MNPKECLSAWAARDRKGEIVKPVSLGARGKHQNSSCLAASAPKEAVEGGAQRTHPASDTAVPPSSTSDNAAAATVERCDNSFCDARGLPSTPGSAAMTPRMSFDNSVCDDRSSPSTPRSAAMPLHAFEGEPRKGQRCEATTWTASSLSDEASAMPPARSGKQDKGVSADTSFAGRERRSEGGQSGRGRRKRTVRRRAAMVQKMERRRNMNGPPAQDARLKNNDTQAHGLRPTAPTCAEQQHTDSAPQHASTRPTLARPPEGREKKPDDGGVDDALRAEQHDTEEDGHGRSEVAGSVVRRVHGARGYGGG